MKKVLVSFFVFLVPFLSAEQSIDLVFEEWVKYHYSGQLIGSPSDVFDQALKLVSKRKGERARECLKNVFRDEETYIDEVIRLFEDADADLTKSSFSFRYFLLDCFSFTDQELDKRNQENRAPPHTPEEIRWHLIEGVLAAFGAGECLILKSPIAAIAAGVTSVHHFLEAAHKYSENMMYQNEIQNSYDRFNDSEVK